MKRRPVLIAALAGITGVVVAIQQPLIAQAVSWPKPHHAYVVGGPWYLMESSLETGGPRPSYLYGAQNGVEYPTALAIGPKGEIYVTRLLGDLTHAAIIAFEREATGSATPVAAIAGSNTFVNEPFGIAVGKTGKIYEVDGGNTINIFAAGAAGNVAPIAQIAGSNTQLASASSIAVDESGEIFVNEYPTILKFAAGATGDVAPVAIGQLPASSFAPSFELQVSRGTVYASIGSDYGDHSEVAELSTADLSVTGAITNPAFYFPFADVDGSGNVYVQNLSFTGPSYIYVYPPGSSSPSRILPSGQFEIGYSGVGYFVVSP